MKLFAKRENQLDEMQELQLLRIESRGFWIAYWLLFASYMFKLLIGMNVSTYITELLIFMAMSLYIFFRCSRYGIWDRHLKPDPKTNLLLSLGASVLFAGAFAIRSYAWFDSMMGSIATFIMLFLILFSLLIVTLSLSSKMIIKRQDQLNHPDDEAE